MKYERYNYKKRFKKSESYKQKVLCVLSQRQKGATYAEISEFCSIKGREVVYRMYVANAEDHDLIKESKT